jgi:predicted amidohydrolase
VFPELSLTGYVLDAEVVSPDDPRLAPLIEACAETGTIALAGAPVPGRGLGVQAETTVPGRSLGVLALDGAGARVAYRKIYLHGTEAVHFAPGEQPEVLEVDGWRLGLAVCRDAGQSEHPARTAALGIDAYLVGAVDTPAEAVVQQERAERIAQAYGIWVAYASCAGPTGPGYPETAGRSGVWSPRGVLVERAGPQPGEIARATLVR